jgi:hypothetical protein
VCAKEKESQAIGNRHSPLRSQITARADDDRREEEEESAISPTGYEN